MISSKPKVLLVITSMSEQDALLVIVYFGLLYDHTHESGWEMQGQHSEMWEMCIISPFLQVKDIISAKICLHRHTCGLLMLANNIYERCSVVWRIFCVDLVTWINLNPLDLFHASIWQRARGKRLERGSKNLESKLDEALCHNQACQMDLSLQVQLEATCKGCC